MEGILTASWKNLLKKTTGFGQIPPCSVHFNIQAGTAPRNDIKPRHYPWKMGFALRPLGRV
jgi:hypothetical protein